MVRKSNFIALSSRVDDVVVIQIKQEATHVPIIKLASSVSLILCETSQRNKQYISKIVGYCQFLF